MILGSCEVKIFVTGAVKIFEKNRTEQKQKIKVLPGHKVCQFTALVTLYSVQCVYQNVG